MSKIFEGSVVSARMQKTAVVEITIRRPHPFYKKLLKRRKRYKVDISDFNVKIGDKVKIVETRPISKEKHFKIAEVLSAGRQGIK